MDIIKKFEPFFDKWYAESFIGAGSFGRVYKIYREEFGEKFYSALKYISIPAEAGEVMQLRMDGMDDESISTYYTEMTKGISAETRLMNKLRGNTNIVSFEDSDIVEKPGGVGYDIFIRMELLTSLPVRMVSKPLDTDEVVKLGVDICSALEVCKKFGIVHRDIKPDNIFISDTGDYKLGDFGIARKLEKTATFMSRKGTYNYMAPEVYKGEKYGAACDIYSLGLVLYRLLNKGRLPFMPPSPMPITPDDRENAVIRRMNGEAMPAPCGADDVLASIVLKACAYGPKDRFASAEEMKKALLKYSRGEHVDIAAPAAAATVPKESDGEAGSVMDYDPGEDSEDELKTVGAYDVPPAAVVAPDKTRGVDPAKPVGPVKPEPAPKEEPPEKAIKDEPEKAVPPKPEEKKKKKTGLLIGIAAALILASVVIFAISGVFGRIPQMPYYFDKDASSQTAETDLTPKIMLWTYSYNTGEEVECSVSGNRVLFSTDAEMDFSKIEHCTIRDFCDPELDLSEEVPIDKQDAVSIETNGNTISFILNDLEHYTQYYISFGVYDSDSSWRSYSVSFVYGKENEIVFFSEKRNNSWSFGSDFALVSLQHKNDKNRFLSANKSGLFLSGKVKNSFKEGKLGNTYLIVNNYLMGMTSDGRIKPVKSEDSAFVYNDEPGVVIHNGILYDLHFLNINGKYISCREDGTVYLSDEKNFDSAWFSSYEADRHVNIIWLIAGIATAVAGVIIGIIGLIRAKRKNEPAKNSLTDAETTVNGESALVEAGAKE